MKKIMQILGPTGVGKSRLAIYLAKRLPSEIISADSMQVYQDFNIGTDKVSARERGGIRHHLIDIFVGCQQFNASIFLEKSFEAAESIISRHKIPIVCGGTALYLKMMIQGIFPEAKQTRVSRTRLNLIAQRCGLWRLWNKLNTVDPLYASKVGQNDKVRIVRGLEIFYNNGLPPSEIFKKNTTPFANYRFVRIGLNLPRDLLYQRIEERVEKMVLKGLFDEAKRLLGKYPPDCPPFKSLGYKEAVMVLNNQLSMAHAKELIKQRTRHFAKRQLSWFRQEKDIHWFSPDDWSAIEEFTRRELSDEG